MLSYWTELPTLNMEHVVYGGHILLVSLWSAVVFAYVSIRTRTSNSAVTVLSESLADELILIAASNAVSEDQQQQQAAAVSAVKDVDDETTHLKGGTVALSLPKDAWDLSSPLERLRWVYIVGYLWMMAGDWLQGPYVYELYRQYGYSSSEIGVLFVAGFASSAVCGTFVASLADSYGRKNFTLLYAAIYIAACATKHFSDYNTLLAGRILGGIATSLLCSAFESWIIAVSRSKKESNYEPVSTFASTADPEAAPVNGSTDQYNQPSTSSSTSSWLSVTFSLAGQGNSLVAICSGLLGEVGNHYGGPVVPFDLAIVCLAVGALFISLTWENDYKSIQQQRTDQRGLWSDVVSALSVWGQALSTMCRSPSMLLVGVIQGCFEASMYVFIFMWSPALASAIDQSSANGSSIVHRVLHGWVFASFMVCAWCGSYLFAYAITATRLSLERLGLITTLAAAISLACVPFVSDVYHRVVLFSIFELCVGAFWPYIASLREKYIDDDSMRSTCMTLYRLPLNVMVVAVLLNIDHMREATLFSLCAGGLALAATANVVLFRL